MKLLKEVLITKADEDYLVVPIGASLKRFNGIIRLNETGKEIWDALTEGKSEGEIADLLVEKYDGVDWERTLKSTRSVIEQLRAGGILTE